jgi:DNA polymerase-4
VRLVTTDDSFAIIAALEQLWPQLAAACAHLPPSNCIKALGVTLADILPKTATQYNLFAPRAAASLTRSTQLGVALDEINQRFGKDAVMVGARIAGRSDQVGTKIAFTRIPDLSEFHQ